MTATVESLRIFWFGERRVAEWEDIVAMHRRDDWPPPEWMVRVEEAPDASVVKRDAA